MRCYACNNILTTPESNRKFKGSGAFTEMCDKCLKEIDVETVEGAADPEAADDEEECYDDD